MKRFSILIIVFFLLPFSIRGVPTQAQTTAPSNNHTAREEAEGKEIWEKLQAKQIECKNLTNDNFEVLGEYFMGQSIGNTERHAVMNQMMQNMMGQNGEEQMHIALGKRSSGCDTNASFPSGYELPMMWWMMGGGGNPMMGWGGFGIFGWLSMILFWILLILGVVVLVRYLSRSGLGKEEKTSLEILKERYARGEINKKEFEEKKRDLG